MRRVLSLGRPLLQISERNSPQLDRLSQLRGAPALSRGIGKVRKFPGCSRGTCHRAVRLVGAAAELRVGGAAPAGGGSVQSRPAPACVGHQIPEPSLQRGCAIKERSAFASSCFAG